VINLENGVRMNQSNRQTRPHIIGRRAERSPMLVLNAGSGPIDPTRLHGAFKSPIWREVRLDVDPGIKPEIVASVTDMREAVPTAHFDAIWCSHILEHLYDHEIPQALAEFRRVLKSDGFALFNCPDLEKIVKLIDTIGVESVAYQSPAGPIAAIDMLHGHRRSIAEGNQFMAHRTSLTAPRLARLLLAADFDEVRVDDGVNFDLWALSLMPDARRVDIQSYFKDTDQKLLAAE
jgi:SAM-dependent methyltransferase